MNTQTFTAHGVRLNVAVAGPENGPVVILLHGFPEFWETWRWHIPYLAEKGYRVLAPDMRGYNLSEKPRELGAYASVELAADVAALIRWTGKAKAFVVGHDWGGSVAWQVALRHPELVEKLVIMASPHPGALADELKTNRKQMLKSWYIFFFQLPLLPELVLTRNRFAKLVRSITSTSKAPAEAEIERYREAWRQPGSMTAMLNYYRAAIRKVNGGPKSGRVKPPTLIIWGDRDAYLGDRLAHASAKRCEEAEVMVLENTSHWIQREAPELIGKRWLEFFGRSE